MIIIIGTYLHDLEYNNACFLNEAALWNANELVTAGTLSSVCSTTYLLGGYNILGNGVTLNQKNDYFTTTYSGLPPHTMIYFSITFWMIDSWDPNADFIQVRFSSR